MALPCYLFDQQTGLCCRTGPELNLVTMNGNLGGLFVERHCLFFRQVAGALLDELTGCHEERSLSAQAEALASPRSKVLQGLKRWIAPLTSKKC